MPGQESPPQPGDGTRQSDGQQRERSKMSRRKVIGVLSLTSLMFAGACAADSADEIAAPERSGAAAKDADAPSADQSESVEAERPSEIAYNDDARPEAAAEEIAPAADEDGEAKNALAAEPSPEPELEPVAVPAKPSKKESSKSLAEKSRVRRAAPKSKGGKLSGAKVGGRGMPGGAIARRPMAPPPPADPTPSGEGYDHIAENDFIAVADDPRSTFSIDVDTASYSNMRRFINDGALPPADAVRIEELVNYFSYNYEAPIGADPFSMNSEVSACPWNDDNLLVSVGLQGKVIDQSEVPARNLVFLLDVSGSMNNADKLPLLKRGLGLLVDNLRANDKVSIVVYAGASGVVLEPTSSKAKILDSLERLSAGGSTNGGEGIELAYRLAKKNFVEGGINRVILATDGDFNVGATSRGELMRLIEQKRKSGVFLSVLGFGTGNVKDATMEQLADKGNGNYAYIDSIMEAKKVLVTEAGATLVTIAKDVKIQVEFNPKEVQTYRLVGYENRKLAHSDFNDDKKDAGEIGAGHSVTALYEVVPAGGRSGKAALVDKLKYQDDTKPSVAATSGELMTVKIRYKKPTGSKSKLLSFPITGEDKSLRNTTKDYRFAASVAEFGMLLRGSKHKGDASYKEVLTLARGALGKDPHGHRQEFVKLVKQASAIASKKRGTLARAE